MSLITRRRSLISVVAAQQSNGTPAFLLVLGVLSRSSGEDPTLQHQLVTKKRSRNIARKLSSNEFEILLYAQFEA